ncbi:MAG: hypothetical protein IJD52_02565 [Alphaproteobacteria bacterium]|nr:hypothetical protein [Alphaproteobacteria bacterium]
MVKVIKIIEDNGITGVRYGTVEVPQTPIENKRTAIERFKKTRATCAAKIRGERTKKK